MGYTSLESRNAELQLPRPRPRHDGTISDEQIFAVVKAEGSLWASLWADEWAVEIYRRAFYSGGNGASARGSRDKYLRVRDDLLRAADIARGLIAAELDEISWEEKCQVLVDQVRRERAEVLAIR